MVGRWSAGVMLMMCASVLGEDFKFYLEAKDRMDPSWISTNYSRVVNKMECASICLRESCVYFGFKDHECHILNSTLNKGECSVDDCVDRGMKIYKMDDGTPHTPLTFAEETTTAGSTKTTEAGFVCDPPDGAEAEVKCPEESYLIKALGSKNPFYRDVLSPTCSTFKDVLVSDEEDVLVFFSFDQGLTIKAYCDGDDYVIYKYKVCVKDKRVVAIIVHCRKIIDPSIIVRTVNATSDDEHVLVNCGPKTGLQKMWLEDAGKTITRTIFQCLELDAEENADTSDAEEKDSDDKDPDAAA